MEESEGFSSGSDEELSDSDVEVITAIVEFTKIISLVLIFSCKTRSRKAF